MILRAGRTLATALLLTGLFVVTAGCVHVPVYQRATLAHPSMSAGQLGMAGASHMEAIQEGASGGAIGAEGGCGCN